MKILLDESLPRMLKTDFGKAFEVKTVRDMGWLGKKNGELLGLMETNNFDFFITMDKNLRHQQNLSKYKFLVFLILSPDNRRETLQKAIPEIKKLISSKNFEKLNQIKL
jgi:predicted nuclease of predicted toxin-antitoxin system